MRGWAYARSLVWQLAVEVDSRLLETSDIVVIDPVIVDTSSQVTLGYHRVCEGDHMILVLSHMTTYPLRLNDVSPTVGILSAGGLSVEYSQPIWECQNHEYKICTAAKNNHYY